jgi:phospholipid/cholesterol/gamma-HCH transport system permease protein
MVVTEEIDALRTMAIDPVEFLLAPKYLAKLIALPCLTILSKACGILAGGPFMRFSTEMAFGVYLRNVVQAIVLRDVLTGLLKSLAFATIIMQMGCLEGFRVRGGPDTVERSATACCQVYFSGNPYRPRIHGHFLSGRREMRQCRKRQPTR